MTYNHKNTKAPRKERKPQSITTYQKTFSTFEDALKELISSNENIAKIFGNSNLTLEEANRKALEAFTNSFPSLDKKENVHWSLNLSANRCIMKTEDFISFGWKVKYVTVDNVVKIENVVATYTQFGINKSATDFLVENKWNILEK